jgi:hypothetical protein
MSVTSTLWEALVLPIARAIRLAQPTLGENKSFDSVVPITLWKAACKDEHATGGRLQ